MWVCGEDSECSGQEQNPSICPDLLHIVGKWQCLTDEDTFCAILRIDTRVRKDVSLGWVHAYANEHQECSLMLRPVGLE